MTVESVTHLLAVVALGSTAAYVIGAWRWLRPRWLYFLLGLVFAFVAAVAFPQRDLATSALIIVLCIAIGILVSVLVGLREAARQDAADRVLDASAREHERTDLPPLPPMQSPVAWAPPAPPEPVAPAPASAAPEPPVSEPPSVGDELGVRQGIDLRDGIIPANGQSTN